MHPYLFRTALFSLPLENVMILCAILAGLWLLWRRSAYKGPAYQDAMLDLTFYLCIAGIAGARIWEMLFTWHDYVETPWDRLAFWNGGMSIQGAILGGLVAALLFAWRRRLRAWGLLDMLAPPTLLGQAIGRMGCLLSGDAYGRPIAQVGWLPSWMGVVYAKETPAWHMFGNTPLVPAEGLEMLLNLLVLAILLRSKWVRMAPGRTVLLYALLYSAERFMLEFLRADSLVIGPLKAAQALSVVVGLTAGWLLVMRRHTA